MTATPVTGQPAPAARAVHPLRRVRRRRGLTTTALADLAGLSPSFISMVETGQRPLQAAGPYQRAGCRAAGAARRDRAEHQPGI